MRFPWRETRVAVAALARGALTRAARRAASAALAAKDSGEVPRDAVDPPSPAELDEAVSRADAHADALEVRLASFPEPPFTAQRLVEILLDPEASGYSTPERLRVAVEKTLAVTGMTAVAAPAARAEGVEGSIDPAPHARRALDPVSLEQTAFVRSMVREAEAEPSDGRAGLYLAGGAPPSPPAAASPGEALPGEARGFAAERTGSLGVERVGEKRAREGEISEPTCADVLERRLPGKPDVGAELVTAGA